MATSSGWRAAAPKFYKIILDPETDSLRVPPEFMKRIGHNLPNRVFLKVPTGPAATEVKLVQSDGKTMLQKGWRKFKVRHSVGFGDFLVFEYNGKSEFNVVVFDKSTVEINYPLTDQEPESDDSVVLLEELSTVNRGKRKAENRQVTPHTIQISDDIYPTKKSHKAKIEESTSEENIYDTGSECSDTVVTHKAVAKATSIAYQKALDFVSGHHNNPKNPFFISLLQQSYVSGGFILNVPVSFARRNIPCVGSISIIMVMHGKKWCVRCLVGKKHTKLSVGWKDFVKDNGLKVGDACAFEVANKSSKLVWNVVIFRS